jgi:hypothetical protein
MTCTPRLIVLIVTCVGVASFTSTAEAAWVVTSTGSGYSKALAMPTGATPTLTTSTNNATVSWAASTIGGAAVSGYTVRRYDSANTLQSIAASCSGLVTATTCTETSIPAGHWKYTVTPKRGSWVGGESAHSALVHIVAAPLSVACGNCGGAGSAYINSSNATSVTIAVTLTASSETTDIVHLTLTDGTTTITPATKPGTSGSGTVTWTAISTATLNQGAITLTAWVTASTGEQSPTATHGYTKDTIAPTATDIQATNKTNGTSGRMETGDQITYTFSEQMNPASLLTGWSGSSTTVTVSVTNNSSTGDTFAIASANYGTVSTNADYVSASITWTGSSMTQSGATVTVTIGTTSGGSNLKTNSTAKNISWAPSATATDLAGNAMSTTSRTETGALDMEF